MDKTIEDVKAFNRSMGIGPGLPAMTDLERKLMAYIAMSMDQIATYAKEVGGFRNMPHILRMRLIIEEVGEVAKALADNEPPHELLKELVDLRYVADGYTELLGFSGVFSQAFARVHASNLSKLDDKGQPIRDAAGKVLKGPNYKPPVLWDILETKHD